MSTEEKDDARGEEADDNAGDHCPLGDGGDLERIGNTDEYECDRCGTTTVK